jgi:hypothetical protein
MALVSYPVMFAEPPVGGRGGKHLDKGGMVQALVEEPYIEPAMRNNWSLLRDDWPSIWYQTPSSTQVALLPS